jgi:hypothetical protein
MQFLRPIIFLMADFVCLGLNPVWNEVLFFKIFVPELAFVNFNILVKNVFVAQYTIPYQCVQQGKGTRRKAFNFVYLSF